MRTCALGILVFETAPCVSKTQNSNTAVLLKLPKRSPEHALPPSKKLLLLAINNSDQVITIKIVSCLNDLFTTFEYQIHLHKICNFSPLQKEGELRKYKNVWSGWGRRYFKLERMYLHYFESKYVSTLNYSVLCYGMETFGC